jgi:hypothetical protein
LIDWQVAVGYSPREGKKNRPLFLPPVYVWGWVGEGEGVGNQSLCLPLLFITFPLWEGGGKPAGYTGDETEREREGEREREKIFGFYLMCHLIWIWEYRTKVIGMRMVYVRGWMNAGRGK